MNSFGRTFKDPRCLVTWFSSTPSRRPPNMLHGPHICDSTILALTAQLPPWWRALTFCGAGWRSPSEAANRLKERWASAWRAFPLANPLAVWVTGGMGRDSAVYTEVRTSAVTHLGFQWGSGRLASGNSHASLLNVFLYSFELFIFVFLSVPNPLYLFWQVEQRK